MTDIAIESVSTSYEKGKKYFQDCINAGRIPFCSSGFVRGSCRGGHQFAAIQFCGKEYCVDCSRDGSPIHQRRVNRWWAHVEKWPEMGYLVATIPESIRPFFLNVDVLKDFRRQFLRRLRENGAYRIKKGLCRWHWFGDCTTCGGKGCFICGQTGSGTFWHPHLNVLFKSGYIENVTTWLEPLKKWMCGYFTKLIDSELNIIRKNRDGWTDEDVTRMDYLLDVRNEIRSDVLVVNYSYVSDPKRIMNKIKYVTRSTFRILQSDIKKLLHNFRNSVVWGWKRGEVSHEPVIPPDCPVCAASGKKMAINWHRLEPYQKNQYIKKHETTGEGTSVYAITTGNSGNHSPGIGFVPINGGKIANHISRLRSAFEGAGN